MIVAPRPSLTAPPDSLTGDRPRHVLVYTDSAGMGGAEISLGHLVATASPQIHITVAGVATEVVNAIADRRPKADRLLLPAAGVQALPAHLWAFHRLQPEIVHLNLCTPWAGATGLLAALSLPHTRVVRVDQLPLRTTGAIDLWRTRALSLRVDAHVAVGEASSRRMEDFYALGRNTVISIPNGVPDWLPEPAQSGRSGQFVVGSVGRLDAMKGHDVLLRAAAQVEGVQVVILGEGEERAALEGLAQQLGIRDRLELPGWVSQPRAYLPGFDVVALPSRSEGFPLAMVEALLAARPVVATGVGSVPEAILNGETGILIEKNDVTGLAEALRRLRDDPELRATLGRQGRDFALAHFTVEAMTAHYEQLWSKLLTLPAKPRLRVTRPHD